MLQSRKSLRKFRHNVRHALISKGTPSIEKFNKIIYHYRMRKRKMVDLHEINQNFHNMFPMRSFIIFEKHIEYIEYSAFDLIFKLLKSSLFKLLVHMIITNFFFFHLLVFLFKQRILYIEYIIL